MGYDGPERRIHRVLVTRNTEYHVRDGVCVGVRSVDTGSWISAHRLIEAHLVGGFAITPQKSLVPMETPQVGHRLVFANRAMDVVTSEVIAIGRPPKEAIPNYIAA